MPPLSSPLQQTLLYGGSIALMKGVSLLMLPFIAHHLTTEAFGRLEVLSSLAIIGSILVGMGLEDTLYRFAGQETDSHKRKTQAARIFGLTLIIGILAWATAWLISPFIARWMPGDASSYEVFLVLSLLALEGCIAIPLGWLRMNDRAPAFFIATTGRALLQALLTLLLLFNGGGVTEILEAGLIAALAQGIWLGLGQLRDSGAAFHRRSYKKLFIYSLPIVAGGLCAFALNGLDRWIIADRMSISQVAQYGVAAKFALAAILLLQPFGMWWSPRRFQVLDGPDGSTEAARFASMGVALALIITVVVGLTAPVLIHWLLPKEYAQAASYATGLTLAMAFKECSELLNIGCFSGRTTRAQFLINLVGAIAGLVLMVPLIESHGVWGAVTALTAAHALRLILFYGVSQHYRPLPYPTARLGALLILCLFWLYCGSWVGDVWQKLALALLASVVMAGAALILKLIPLPQRPVYGKAGAQCT
ncbi:MAG: lipopolysaccharide biosynthesis protein [Sedimenticola sp.]